MICPAGTQRESGSNSTGGNKEMSAHRPWRCWRSPSATLRGLGMSLPRSNRGNEGPSTWASAHTLLCFHRRWVVGVGTETTCANLSSSFLMPRFALQIKKKTSWTPYCVSAHPYHPFSSHTLQRKRSGPNTWAFIATIAESNRVKESQRELKRVKESQRETKRAKESQRESKRDIEMQREAKRAKESHRESQIVKESQRGSKRAKEGQRESKRVKESQRESKRGKESQRESKRLKESPREPKRVRNCQRAKESQ